MRFFTNPRKPMILAVARPYPEKNITTLVKAFGECRPLRELANLVRLILVDMMFFCFCYRTITTSLKMWNDLVFFAYFWFCIPDIDNG